MSENFKPSLDRPDRTLGDEWADWDGRSDRNIQSGPWLFVGFSFFVIFLINFGFSFLYYMVLPRLGQFNGWISPLLFVLLVLWILLSTAIWVELALTIYFKKNYFFFKKQVFFVFDLVFARVFKLAKIFRISRDRMGHSFVVVSNIVVRVVDSEPKEKRLMILLPRCLTKDDLQKIYKIKDRFPVEIFTVSGGELARKKVKEYNPSAIIGVACERDLVSGIRDVASKIPVIGIPNCRPNGPCKDTMVDVEEIEHAVEFYFK